MSNPELDRFGPFFVFQLAMRPLAGEGDMLDVLERANKPKALSTPVKRGAANREWFARNACSFV
ncbi:MAG: hypothetical protein WAU39_14810 [Polyangiales bacterium]